MYDHVGCSQQRRCKVLNCPFGVFPPPSLSYDCIAPNELESAKPIEDQELLSSETFNKDERYTEVFVNMNFDTHIDGWIFRPFPSTTRDLYSKKYLFRATPPAAVIDPTPTIGTTHVTASSTTPSL